MIICAVTLHSAAQFLGKFGFWMFGISFSLLLLIVCAAFLVMIFKGTPESVGHISKAKAVAASCSSSHGGAS